MGKLVVLMITAFVDMVGLLMIIPLLPFYAKDFGANGLTIGFLISSFALAQLVTAPMWGRFSDRYGRRPALLLALSAAAIAYVVFGFANSLWLLFLSRIVQGAGGGTVSVIQAYVADALPPEERAKGLGWLSAATNAGVAIGPALGGELTAHLGRSAPGLAAASLCVVNIIFTWFYLTESRVADKDHPSRPRLRSRDAVARVVAHSAEPASRLIWIYALAMGAFQGAMAILALFLSARFAITAETIGRFFTYIGTISVLSRALVLGRAVDRFGEARLSRFGSSLLALGIGLLPFIYPLRDPAAIAAHLGLSVAFVRILPYVPLGLCIALLPLGTAFTFPCVTALLSRVTPNSERGLYMGVQQTFGGLARVIFPILMGYAFDRFIELPFLVSAALVVGTIYLGLGMEAYIRPKAAPDPAPAA